MTTVYPEGLTPDEIDRRLEAREGHDAAALRRDADDAAVMATLPRNWDAVTNPTTKDAIAARIAYDQKPWWKRCWTTLRRERPAGLVDRYPTSRWPQ